MPFKKNESMNSRQLSQKWPFPRYKLFENELRKYASRYFKSKGYNTHPRMPYCLSKWIDWKNNIILEEASSYIEKFKTYCEQNGKPFPLHKYIHHGLSSQAMAFNLIGPLITRSDYEPLINVLEKKNIKSVQDICSAEFEFEDRNVFNEDSGQPTSIDIVLKDKQNIPIIFIECKLAEKEFGGCSVFAGGDCNGKNPLQNKDQCYLHFIGRRYWDLMDKYKFSELLSNEKQCMFTSYYQYFREVLFSIEKGGIFVLISDDRSPVFHCEVGGVEKGLMSFLFDFIPHDYRKYIVSISVQELIGSIKKSGKHNDWIGEFEIKYGLK